MGDVLCLKAAEFICSTGKVVHDRIMKIQSDSFAYKETDVANGLSVSQLHTVKILSESGEMTMNELAERLAVSPPSASSMVDRLVNKGMVSREHCTRDRRRVVVQISPEAVNIAEKIKSNILHLFVELVDKIGIETAQEWCEVLSAVEAALTEKPGGPNSL